MNAMLSVLLNYQKSIEYDLHNFGKSEEGSGIVGGIVYSIIIIWLLVMFSYSVVIPVIKYIVNEIRAYLKK